MSKPRLVAYISDWHQSKSPAFSIILSDPLASYLDIEFRNVRTYEAEKQDCPIVFCQGLPYQRLPTTSKYPISWIPMVDNHLHYPPEFWGKLPRYLKVVAFSKLIKDLARLAQLPVFYVTFYLNPDNFTPARWSDKLSLMYWNRSNLLSAKTLLKLGELLKIDEIMFRETMDPAMPRLNYYVPQSRNKYLSVHLIRDVASQRDYLDYLERANVYLAPRAKEGIGLSFLEALASGCAVIAINFPTMNEYINHQVNGFLLPYKSEVLIARRNRYVMTEKLKKRNLFTRIIGSIWKKIPYAAIVNVQDLDVEALMSLDLESLGNKAREDHYSGYKVWQSRLNEFAYFLVS